MNPLIRQVDQFLGWTAAIGPEGARALRGTLASSMLTFIVFVFSILLVAVQLASAQLTPRIIAIIYRTGIIRFSLTVFVFAFTYSLGALSRIEGAVPRLSAWVAAYSCVASIGVFLCMIDYVGKSLRPVSLLTRIGREAQGSAVPALLRWRWHRRSRTESGGRHQAGAHDGAGPGVRVPHHRGHRGEGALAGDQ